MYAAFIDRIHRPTSPANATSCNAMRKKNNLSSSPSPNRVTSPKSPKMSSLNRKKVQNCSAQRARSPLASENCKPLPQSSSSSNLVNSVQTLTIGDEAKSQCKTDQPHLNSCKASTASSEPSAASGISSPELAEQVAANRAPILLDCRSFISYNLCHIRGAINVGCADRVTKRRLATGKLGVADLIKCPVNRELFQNNQCADVIVYDDDSVSVDAAGAGTCQAGSMVLVMKSLVAKQAKVHFLKGETE